MLELEDGGGGGEERRERGEGKKGRAGEREER